MGRISKASVGTFIKLIKGRIIRTNGAANQRGGTQLQELQRMERPTSETIQELRSTQVIFSGEILYCECFSCRDDRVRYVKIYSF